MSHEWCEVPLKIDRATVVTMSRRGARGHRTKRKDRTFHRRNATPCTTHHYTPTSTAPAGALMFHHPALGRASHGWVPVNTHDTPVLASVREAVDSSDHKHIKSPNVKPYGTVKSRKFAQKKRSVSNHFGRSRMLLLKPPSRSRSFAIAHIQACTFTARAGLTLPKLAHM